ncbi:MAG: acyl carrier protein [Deltaproteobacteria bacterium]|nr:acyl carrier protein [Deltaproteobacteria bacterium]
MQDYEEILKRVCELLVPFVEQGTAILEDSDFVADLNFDSLKVMKLVEQVEDEYDISIPLNILPDVQTVRDFAKQLQKLVAS